MGMEKEKNHALSRQPPEPAGRQGGSGRSIREALSNFSKWNNRWSRTLLPASSGTPGTDRYTEITRLSGTPQPRPGLPGPGGHGQKSETPELPRLAPEQLQALAAATSRLLLAFQHRPFHVPLPRQQTPARPRGFTGAPQTNVLPEPPAGLREGCPTSPSPKFAPHPPHPPVCARPRAPLRTLNSPARGDSRARRPGRCGTAVHLLAAAPPGRPGGRDAAPLPAGPGSAARLPPRTRCQTRAFGGSRNLFSIQRHSALAREQGREAKHL